MLPFRAFPLLVNRHLQILVASQVNLTAEPPSVTRLVALEDGDRIALEVSVPAGWQPAAPTVLMVHGLCGCHGSPYMVRMASKLYRLGVRVVRMNMRGCGSGRGLARQPYHSGRSEDVLAALEVLHGDAPRSSTTLIGFSLGGNIVLKLAGELQARAARYVQQVVAVCPPVDLAVCVRLLAQPANWLYERYFVRRLRAAVCDRQALFPDVPPVELPATLSLYAFDNLYTAPQCGFKDADDYYRRCSAAPIIPAITIPCRILFATDDPFIDASVLRRVALPSNIQLVQTARGGHLGFLGIPGYAGGFRWMDRLLLEWVLAMTPMPWASYQPNWMPPDQSGAHWTAR